MISGLYRGWLTALLLVVPLSVTAVDNDTRLVEAAKRSDIQLLRTLLGKEVDVNVATTDGTTALHWAAHWDNAEIADLLLQSGSKPGPANIYGVTPLQLACTNRSDIMVEKLLQAGADPDAALWTGETVLMNCSRTGATAAVAALLAAGAKVNVAESNQGLTALMWAAAGGRSEIVKLLIENGADIKSTTIAMPDKLPNNCRICPWVPSPGGFTPLLFAARSGDLETARLLLDAGADPDEATAEDGNSLVIASAGGHEALALYLLERGADPNVADGNGVTALHHAFQAGLSRMNGITYDPVYRRRPSNMPALVKALLQAGADPDAQIASSYQIGPDIRDRCESLPEMKGATPFLLAAVSADVPLISLLAESGADPRLAMDDGTTPLMAAAQGACKVSTQRGEEKNTNEVNAALQAVKAIVEMGVDVNAANAGGETALHIAAFAGAEPVVQYLVARGARVDVKNKSGETPWSMAMGISPVLEDRGAYGSHASTAALLLSLGAVKISREDMNLPDPYLNPSAKKDPIRADQNRVIGR